MVVLCRLKVPSMFISGASFLPGTFGGKPVTIQDVFEAVGQHSVRQLSDADLETLEQHACPSAGACGAQITANNKGTGSEAIRVGLPYLAGGPGPHRIRDALCRNVGGKGLDL